MQCNICKHKNNCDAHKEIKSFIANNKSKYNLHVDINFKYNCEAYLKEENKK